VPLQQFVIKRFELDKVTIVSGLLQAPGTKRAVAHLALFRVRIVHSKGLRNPAHQIYPCSVKDPWDALPIRSRRERIGSPAIPPHDTLGSSDESFPLRLSLVNHMLDKACCLFVLFLALAPCVQAQNGKEAAPAAPVNAPAPLYVIQPNDILEIFVWKEPDLTRKVLVRPDGRISFPLVQDMQASGISPGELKTQIEKKLKEYLESPNVTIIVDAIQSYKVYVTGKVQKPGAILAEKPITVLQALAMAGGFQEYAKGSEMSVIRYYGNENIVFKFDYSEVTRGKASNQNIVLRSGDVVVVP
jgi:polysaccharide export outer membrane protein